MTRYYSYFYEPLFSYSLISIADDWVKRRIGQLEWERITVCVGFDINCGAQSLFITEPRTRVMRLHFLAYQLFYLKIAIILLLWAWCYFATHESTGRNSRQVSRKIEWSCCDRLLVTRRSVQNIGSARAKSAKWCEIFFGPERDRKLVKRNNERAAQGKSASGELLTTRTRCDADAWYAAGIQLSGILQSRYFVNAAKWQKFLNEPKWITFTTPNCYQSNFVPLWAQA